MNIETSFEDLSITSVFVYKLTYVGKKRGLVDLNFFFFVKGFSLILINIIIYQIIMEEFPQDIETELMNHLGFLVIYISV